MEFLWEATLRLLDLFCKAGGAGMGYHRAGFDVFGVDIEPQPNYPFNFIQADALTLGFSFLASFDAIHASPPCQKYSAMTKRWVGRSDDHPDLILATRQLLIASGRPYIIENVPGAPLIDPIMLCGTMFGLETENGNQLRRHRLFETSFEIGMTPPCAHNTASAIGVHGGGQHPNRRRTIGVYGSTGGSSKRDGIDFFGIEARRQVMGIDWMTGKELNQAIPPAYTEWIGKQLMQELRRAA